MLMSMSSTGIVPSKKWVTQAQNVRDAAGRVAPIWANVWELATGYMDNPQGSYYQVAKISRLGYVAPSIKELVVHAFLDAQGAGTADLEHSMAKGSGDDIKVAAGTQSEVGPDLF
jgi:hypothetical protein